jgi:hypothetical protein
MLENLLSSVYGGTNERRLGLVSVRVCVADHPAESTRRVTMIGTRLDCVKTSARASAAVSTPCYSFTRTGRNPFELMLPFITPEKVIPPFFQQWIIAGRSQLSQPTTLRMQTKHGVNATQRGLERPLPRV